jgi:heptosyltransferase III
MKILFITATRLGDAVLSTGALDYFMRLYPDAEITVACGPVAAGIFAPAPRVRKVIALKKEPYAGHWLKLAQETFGKRWDIIVDLRNSVLSRLMRADKKYIWGGADKRKHKIEQIAEVLGGVSPPPAPALWFDGDTLAGAESIAPAGGPILGIGPTANWPGKEWPPENFSALIQRLTAADGLLPGARVAVFAAPGEESRARSVLDGVPAGRRVDVIAKGPPLLSAAVLRRCAFYVGNDSGLTHAAAAVGVPTLALFGYGWPELYRPWGSHAAYVSTPETPQQLIAPYPSTSDVKSSLMMSLTVDAAHEAALNLWRTLGSSVAAK